MERTRTRANNEPRDINSVTSQIEEDANGIHYGVIMTFVHYRVLHTFANYSIAILLFFQTEESRSLQPGWMEAPLVYSDQHQRTRCTGAIGLCSLHDSDMHLFSVRVFLQTVSRLLYEVDAVDTTFIIK